MSLQDRITTSITEAMKSKDQDRLSILRLLRSNIKNKEIDVGHSLADEEIQAVLRTMVKQGKDALGDFESAGREDLAEHQRMELNYLQEWLPAELSDEDLEVLCRQAVEQAGSAFGPAMGACMKAVSGRADSVRVKDVLMRLLKDGSS